jgi:hypothetical protein
MNADVKPSFQGEVMLAGWNDSHTGGAKITFWLPDDADLEVFRTMTVKKGKVAGQRFMMVLVEIDDDEMPKQQTNHRASSDAHLMITGDAFVRYVRQTIAGAQDWDAAKVRLWAKAAMEVGSLSELDSDPRALKRFHEVVRRPFAEWMDNAGFTEEDSDAPPGD